ncbi:MAG: hypothetical protein KDH98_18765 [Calditrichaeota bacterium]|nr:hypothetical protein [Calditrichota bacterium]
MEIKRILKNPFKTAFITNRRFFKFGEDHLQRLKAYNVANALDDTITTTEPKVSAFVQALNVVDQQEVLKKSATYSMQAAQKTFVKAVRRQHGLISAKWGTDSVEYKAFFPLGLREYSHPTLENIGTLMNRFAAMAQTYVADLGQAFVDQFTDIRDNFVAARQAQLLQFGEFEEAKTLLRDTRETLETQLMQNIYTLGMKHIGNSDRGMDYFDMSIIRKPKRTKNDPVTE